MLCSLFFYSLNFIVMKKFHLTSKAGLRFIKRRPITYVCTLMIVIVCSLFTGLLFGHGVVGFAAIPVLGVGFNDFYKKAGRAVFSHNHYNLYMRGYKIPNNKKSNGQAVQRQYIRDFAKAWKGDTVNRTSWINYGATHPIEKKGRIIYLTGEATFIQFNLISQICTGDVTLITAAPVVSTTFPILTGLTVVTNSGPDSVTVEPLNIGDYVSGMKCEIKCSPQLSPGTYTRKKMVVLGCYTPSAVTPIDITSAYVAKFGPLQVGLKIYFEARLIMPTGEADLWVSADSLITTVGP